MFSLIKNIINKILLDVFDEQNEAQKTMSNISWLYCNRVMRLVLCFATGIWLARYLGPSDYGYYSFIVSFCTLFMPVLYSVNADVITHEYLVNKNGSISGSIFLVKTFSAFIYAGLVFVASRLLSMEDTLIYPLCVCIVAMSLKVGDMFSSFLFAKSKYDLVAKVRLFALGAFVILRIYFIISEKQMLFFLWAIFLENVIEFIALFCVALRYRFFQSARVQLSEVKKILKRSLPLLMSAVVIIIYQRIDQLMIRHFLDYSQVGLYSVAVHIGEAMNFVPWVIVTALFPSLVASKKKSNAEYYKRLQKTFSIVFFASVFCVVTVFFCAPLLLEKLFGVKYYGSIVSLKLLVLALLPVAWTTVSLKHFVIERKEHYMFKIHFAGALINVLLNCVFIPCWGINGAALATLVTWCLVSIIFDLFFKTLHPLFIMKLRSIILANIKS